jgi:hypothetical protein
MNSPPSGSATDLIMKSPGGYIRIAALVVALLAMFLPAINVNALGMSVGVSLMQGAAWALIFPILIAVALVSPAVSALSPYTRILDIAAAVFGLLASIWLITQIMSVPSSPGIDASMLASVGIGIGGFALFIATILAAVPAVQSFMKR